MIQYSGRRLCAGPVGDRSYVPGIARNDARMATERGSPGLRGGDVDAQDPLGRGQERGIFLELGSQGVAFVLHDGARLEHVALPAASGTLPREPM